MAATVGTLTLMSTPAQAQVGSVVDPAGDASGSGLDIVSASVKNLDHTIVARVRFVESVRGDLVVSIDPRGARGVRLVSEYRPVAHTESFVLPGAFTDGSGDDTAVDCPGFRVHGSAERPVARLELPSSCLQDGDFGAIRFAVLTERRGDTDYAPEKADGDLGSSSWIPRG
ncbi:MAG: hypothetical protein JWN22_3588 [Nocardioides sp.]|nr:hypothetical protein [Nocardioides sp.]